MIVEQKALSIRVSGGLPAKAAGRGSFLIFPGARIVFNPQRVVSRGVWELNEFAFLAARCELRQLALRSI